MQLWRTNSCYLCCQSEGRCLHSKMLITVFCRSSQELHFLHAKISCYLTDTNHCATWDRLLLSLSKMLQTVDIMYTFFKIKTGQKWTNVTAKHEICYFSIKTSWSTLWVGMIRLVPSHLSSHCESTKHIEQHVKGLFCFFPQDTIKPDYEEPECLCHSLVTIPHLPILGLQLARQNQAHHFSVPFQRFQKPADDVM